MAKKAFKIKIVLERMYETDDDRGVLIDAFDESVIGFCLDLMFDSSAEALIEIEEVSNG